MNKTKLIFFLNGKNKAKSEWNRKQTKLKQRRKPANKIKQGKLSEEDQRGTITKDKMFKLGSQLAAHVEQNESCKDLGLQMCKKNPIGQSICKIALVRGFSSKVSSRASDLDARSA